MDGELQLQLDPLDQVIAEVRLGRPILMVDDSTRENEADLVVAAELVTPESVNFMIQHGKGLICVSLEEQRLAQLKIPLQVVENSSVLGTNFAVSVDHYSCKELGITATSRAKAIRALVDPRSRPEDFVKPGHVFPLAAVPAGVLRRRGQTEGSVDLARIAGLVPAGVICEVMGADGSMLRGDGLEEFRKQHHLKLTSVEEIVRYRLRHEVSLRRVAEGKLADIRGAALLKGAVPLPSGERLVGASSGMKLLVYLDDVDQLEHLVLVKGEPTDGCLVRIHSECLTGDVFGSRRCDCGYQLETSLATIERVGEGVLIYLYQEGRGIGLGNKLRAYELQDQGLDTVDANLHLGFAPDLREYRVAAKILEDLGVHQLRLMTNNPEKVSELEEFGLKVVERVAIVAAEDEFNAEYLRAKQDRFGHHLSRD